MAAKVRVLIVDDSTFFRKRIREQLERNAEVAVIGEAVNGREAVELAMSLNPDLITMDVAMPLMDGIAAVREIMHRKPTDILMVSALTRDGAKATLDALEAGAVDFLTKQGGFGESGEDATTISLGDRVINIARRKRERRVVAPVPKPPVHTPAPEKRNGSLRLVIIGASTGGPVAVQSVLSALPANYTYPVLVAVHMPGEFTATFAERLNGICRIDVAQAVDGATLSPGRVLIAPGGMQTLVECRGGRSVVRVMPGGDQLYRPSVDLTFGSAARALGNGVQAVVLTGMGSDGTEGARMLRERGSSVWSQDQASSVVYGMPYSVAKAGHSSRVLALTDIGSALAGLA